MPRRRLAPPICSSETLITESPPLRASALEPRRLREKSIGKAMGEATALTVVRSADHLTGTAGRAIITSVTRATDRARRAPGRVGALTISNLRINAAPANRKRII
jgi:hypothetical protein